MDDLGSKARKLLDAEFKLDPRQSVNSAAHKAIAKALVSSAEPKLTQGAMAELAAWRARFPQYEFRAQDDVVTLRLATPVVAAVPDAAQVLPPLPRPRYRMASCGLATDAYSPEQMGRPSPLSCQLR